MKSMAGPWRRFKSELRVKYYDPYPTHEERILHVPPKVSTEHWVKFCENEDNVKQQESRLEHKIKRAKYDYAHCAGRKPYALVRADLVCILFKQGSVLPHTCIKCLTPLIL